MKFFQTVMGRQFYDGTAPRIADALERIAASLSKQDERDRRIADALDVVDEQLAAGACDCDDARACAWHRVARALGRLD